MLLRRYSSNIYTRVNQWKSVFSLTVQSCLREHLTLTISGFLACIIMFFLFFPFWLPCGTWSSYVRDGQGSDPSPVVNHAQLQQYQIPNPVCQAGDQSRVPGLQRWCQSCCTTVGTAAPLCILKAKVLGMTMIKPYTVNEILSCFYLMEAKMPTA